MSSPSSAAPDGAPPGQAAPRLPSIDALRGFDMLWIIGGAAVLRAIAESTGWSWAAALADQTTHVHWNGFTLWDAIFPLFLFLAGVSLPFSFEARRARGATEAELWRRATRRGLTLVLLGLIYNGLLAMDWGNLRCAGVLARIGLAWMLAAWISLAARSVRAQAAWVLGILLGYHTLLTMVPVPGVGPANLDPGRTIVDWFDQRFLPGSLYHGDRDPEGWLSTLPAAAGALTGVLAGRYLLARTRAGAGAGLGLAGAGAGCVVLAGLWSLALPLNKNLWTSSFVLWTSGLSLLLLAGFHQVIDRAGWTRWCLPLRVIGANAIAVYLAQRFIDFDSAGVWLLSRGASLVHPAVAGLSFKWLLLYLLYRRGWFLRV